MCSDNKPAKENPNIEWNVAETQINKLKIDSYNVVASNVVHQHTHTHLKKNYFIIISFINSYVDEHMQYSIYKQYVQVLYTLIWNEPYNIA